MAKKSEAVKETGKFKDVQEVLELHSFARDLYDKANRENDNIESLVFGEWEAPKDVADTGYRPHRPSRPRAHLDNFRRNLAMGIGSDMELKVLPLKTGDTEQEKCTKIEWWLDGMDRQLEWETDRDYKRDALFWYLLRGRACFEQVFRPEYKGTGQFPFDITADDPACIFPVRGRRGVLWYTKEYTMYGMELRRSLQSRGRDYGFIPKKKENEEFTVVEYRDDKYYAAVCEDEFLVNATPDLGFVPLAEAHCMDTPLKDAQYAYQSVLQPVIDEFKMQAELAEKMRYGLKLFFYPYLFTVSPSGQPVIIDVTNPGVFEPLAPGTKLEQVQVNVNHAIFQSLMAYTQSGINLGTMPESTFGMGPQGLESGFAISQVLQQSKMAVLDKIPNFARALGRSYSNILKWVEKVGKAEGLSLGVPVDYDE